MSELYEARQHPEDLGENPSLKQQHSSRNLLAIDYSISKRYSLCLFFVLFTDAYNFSVSSWLLLTWSEMPAVIMHGKSSMWQICDCFLFMWWQAAKFITVHSRVVVSNSKLLSTMWKVTWTQKGKRVLKNPVVMLECWESESCAHRQCIGFSVSLYLQTHTQSL